MKPQPLYDISKRYVVEYTHEAWSQWWPFYSSSSKKRAEESLKFHQSRRTDPKISFRITVRGA